MKLDKLSAKGAHNFYRNPANGVIYFRRYSNGKEITLSTRTTKLEEAKRYVSERLQEAIDKPVHARNKTALELFDGWVKGKETLNKRKGTITSMLATRRYLAPYLSSMRPEEITEAWWLETYVPQVRANTHEERKFFNDWKWTRAFVRSLHKSGVIKALPNLENPDIRKTIGKVFTDEEVELLLNYARSEDLYLAILMAVTMGMRRWEIFGLQVSRINPVRKTIALTEEDTKTKKAREFAISSDVWLYLAPRLSSGSMWVFPQKKDPSKPLHKDGFKTGWRNLKKFCGVTGRFHDLRHTFLTKAFKAPGANPALICHYAGLSLEVAERVYLHFNAEDTRAVAGLVAFGDSGKIRGKELQQ